MTHGIQVTSSGGAGSEHTDAGASAKRRALQETEQGGPVVSVNTAQGLLEAVTLGEPHIEITEHLDLAGLPLITPDDPTLSLATSLLGVLPPAVKSIRVRLLMLCWSRGHRCRGWGLLFS